MTNKITFFSLFLLTLNASAQNNCNLSALNLQADSALSEAKEALFIYDLRGFDEISNRYNNLKQNYFREIANDVFNLQGRIIFFPNANMKSDSEQDVAGFYVTPNNKITIALNNQIRKNSSEECVLKDFIYLQEQADQHLLAHEFQHMKDNRSGVKTEIASKISEIVKSGNVQKEDFLHFVIPISYLMEQRGYSEQIRIMRKSLAEFGFIDYDGLKLDKSKAKFAIHNRVIIFKANYSDKMNVSLKAIQSKYPLQFEAVLELLDKYAYRGQLSNKAMLKPHFRNKK